MNTLNGQELEIFRAGQKLPGKREFSSVEVAQIARDYTPGHHEAPGVIGHPKVDSPAWTWVKSLRAVGNSLYATFHDTAPAFDAALTAKQFKKRSAAFEPAGDGKWRLRHVGFLGGTPPAIKGLQDATFSSDEFEEFEFSDTTPGDDMPDPQVDKKTIADTIREVFADMFGGKEKGAPADTAALEQRLAAQFADELKREREAREAQQQEFADYQAKHEKARKGDAAKGAVDKLKADGHWLPAFDHMGVSEMFSALSESGVEEIEFADGKDSKKKLAPIAALSSLVGGLARMVPRGVEFSAEDLKDGEPVVAPKVDGVQVDDGSVKFDAAVKALATEKKIPYGQALQELTRQGKSSASYAKTAAGAV